MRWLQVDVILKEKISAIREDCLCISLARILAPRLLVDKAVLNDSKCECSLQHQQNNWRLEGSEIGISNIRTGFSHVLFSSTLGSSS